MGGRLTDHDEAVAGLRIASARTQPDGTIDDISGGTLNAENPVTLGAADSQSGVTRAWDQFSGGRSPSSHIPPSAPSLSTEGYQPTASTAIVYVPRPPKRLSTSKKYSEEVSALHSQVVLDLEKFDGNVIPSAA